MTEQKTAGDSFIPFFRPSFTSAEEEAVIRVLRSGWLTTGKEAIEFEKEFASFVGSDHCLAVNSASSGLLLAMDAFGIGPGTKILTTPYTFVSTATSARPTVRPSLPRTSTCRARSLPRCALSECAACCT